MSNIHDLEYGPNPPGAQYEHSDIDPSIGYKFAVWLLVAMLMSAGIVYGTFWFFNRQQQAANVAAQKYPLALGQEPDRRPFPHLQTQPFKDVYLLRKAETERLESYAWQDKGAGVTRIPIERAMELMLERGLPARSGGADGINVVVQDSSSGRTIAPR
ncbi:MAG: hypothetical protein ABI665_27690 [Vicinamibacterales bacterium]